MMTLQRSAARLAVRQCRHPVWQWAAGISYHSYPLPSKIPETPRNRNIPGSSIAQPEPLPKVHETRPPPQHNPVPTPPAAPSELKADEAPATANSNTNTNTTRRTTPTATTIATATATATATAAPGLAQVESATEMHPPPTQAQTSARPRSKLRARKAAIKLTPAAVEQLRALLDQPEPKLIKVGVKNRGCSGLAYHLSYVDKPGPFDESVEQDGVSVLIDSKALFSIIGSEMDWTEDMLSQRFVFKNPNIKEECGCGESFMV